MKLTKVEPKQLQQSIKDNPVILDFFTKEKELNAEIATALHQLYLFQAKADPETLPSLLLSHLPRYKQDEHGVKESYKDTHSGQSKIGTQTVWDGKGFQELCLELAYRDPLLKDRSEDGVFPLSYNLWSKLLAEDKSRDKSDSFAVFTLLASKIKQEISELDLADINRFLSFFEAKLKDKKAFKKFIYDDLSVRSLSENLIDSKHSAVCAVWQDTITALNAAQAAAQIKHDASELLKLMNGVIAPKKSFSGLFKVVDKKQDDFYKEIRGSLERITKDASPEKEDLKNAVNKLIVHAFNAGRKTLVKEIKERFKPYIDIWQASANLNIISPDKVEKFQRMFTEQAKHKTGDEVDLNMLELARDREIAGKRHTS